MRLLLLLTALLASTPARAAEPPCLTRNLPSARTGAWAAVEADLLPMKNRPRVCSLLLAQALHHNRKYTFVVQVLRPLYEADPNDLQVLALLGAGLLGLGDTDGALLVLAPAGETPRATGWSRLARYHLAVAELRSGEDRRARRRFSRLDRELGIKSTSPLAEPLRGFLSLAREGLRRRSRNARPRVLLATGVQYDSNATYNPMDPELATVSGSPASWRSHLRGSASLPLRLGAGTHLVARGSGYRSFHTNEAADDFDYTDLAGSLGLERFDVWLGADARLDLTWRSRIGFLDGGPLTPEPDFFAFFERHSLVGGLRLEPSRRWRLGLEAEGGFQRFAELARNDRGGGLSAAIAWRPIDEMEIGLSSSNYRREAERAGYTRWELFQRIHVLARLPLGLELLASARHGWTDYPDSMGFFEDGVTRTDRLLNGGVRLGRSLPLGLSVAVDAGWRRRSSNIDRMAYEGWSVGLSLTWTTNIGGEP